MIDTSLIKKLRESTGAGMMDCRNALIEGANNLDDAIAWLRKKGLSTAAKKADRVAAEGLIGVNLSSDHKRAVAVEVNSETDFVALNENFQNLVESIVLAADKANDIAELESINLASGKAVKEAIVDNIASIGENLLLRRMIKVEVSEGIVASYVHNATKDKDGNIKKNLGKIGVLVALESNAADVTALQDLGKKIALHIAASKPLYLSKDAIPASVIESETNILTEQCMASGKPENIVKNMVQGKLNNFYTDNVLLNQIFVMDNKSTIQELVANTAKNLGVEIKLASFVRFECGEGVEVVKSDFAAEVAKMSQ
jgi:elongation factor Ts